MSWLRNHFPKVKDRILEDANFVNSSFGELIRTTPTLFWSYVGDRDYAILTRKSDNGESILSPTG